MRWNAYNAARRPLCVVLAAGAVLMTACVSGQAQAQEKTQESYEMLYLTNLPDSREANDVMTALRNMLPRARIYRVESANAIAMSADANDLAIAKKIIAELDHPRKTYRLTFTITDGENGHPAQHFAMIVSPGRKTTLKQGTRIPIMVGANNDGSAQNAQVQYADVGLTIQAAIDGYGNGTRLQTKIEESSVGEEKPGINAQDPVIHQSVLEGESAASIGKPVVLGSMDVPGTGKQMEVQVLTEVVH